MPLPQTRRQRVDPSQPEAAGICDRCSFVYSLADLVWQYDYRGASLANLRLRVCPRCLDDPQPQLRPKAVPADPVPVRDPRPPYWRSQQGPPPPAIPVWQLIEPDHPAVPVPTGNYLLASTGVLFVLAGTTGGYIVVQQ